jgi:hypothetical protein
VSYVYHLELKKIEMVLTERSKKSRDTVPLQGLRPRSGIRRTREVMRHNKKDREIADSSNDNGGSDSGQNKVGIGLS